MSDRPPPISPFDPAHPSDVGAFVRDQILGLVTTSGPPAHVTPLPLLAQLNAEGGVTEFFGHFGRSNPQIEALQADPRALVIFMGPQAYVPTAWVSPTGWAPTWNYALAYFEVEVRFDAGENDRALAELVETMEQGQWTTDRMGARYEPLAQRILAFRARVIRQVGKFKLGQDETPETFEKIVQHLSPSPLAELMRRTREGADT
jgi:transcriptional regulator